MAILEKVFEYVLINYRWIFVVFFLLPLSVVYDAFYYFRCRLTFSLFSNPKHHDKRVKQVQKQVAAWNASGQKTPMCTSRPGWQTMSFRRGKYKSSLQCIDIQLMDILDVDTERQVVRVEPLVTMGQITAVLTPLGWTLPIVPELDDLTVGGMVNGTGVETSSYKFGLFQHICEAYEVVLADASVVRCTKDENPDLFYSIPWSHGTLGFVVSAEIRIVPAKKYVRVDYIPTTSLQETAAIVEQEVGEKDNDFVEGLAFSKDSAVVMVAKMTDDYEPGKLNEIGLFHKPWFFTHVQKYLTKGRGFEYIPLREYYHRHSRSIFWEIQDIIPFGNNPIFRHLFGWMVPPKISLLKLTQTETIKKFYERYQFIQDIIVPIKTLRESIEFLDNNINVYPLWICPVNLFPDPGMVHSRNDKPDMFVDVGIYGSPKVKSYEAEKSTRDVEAFVRHVKGYQMLYADTYQTREEFRDMFDHSQYDLVRQRYQCNKAFPEVYDKINKNVRY